MDRNLHAAPFAFAAFAFLCCSTAASAAEFYLGGGTTGAEVGVAQPVGSGLTLRLEGNALTYRTHFNTDGIDYDARLKANNAGAYVDAFVSGGIRVTAGALMGNRKFHGTATGLNGSVSLNGVSYPVTPGDALDFEAKFPSVTPYLGLGYGHRGGGDAGTGLRVYADAGVAYGRPKVTLSPTASLLTKVGEANVLAEQQTVQDKADKYRVYPVLKLGLGYAF